MGEDLYQNEHMRAIVKKIKNEFEYLINPIFDVEETAQNISPEVEQKQKTPDSGYFPMNQEIQYQSTHILQTLPKEQDNVRIKAKQQKSEEMAQILSGKQIRGKYEQSGNELFIRHVKEAKSRVYMFINGLIEVLHSDFGENSVNSKSPRREKVEFLRKLSKELDPHYSDFNQFKNLLDESLRDILKITLDKEEAFIPKPKLRFSEFIAIKNHFSPH